MCAKAISQSMIHSPTIEVSTEPLVTEDHISTLGEFSEVLTSFTGAPVSVLGEDHIRIPTPQIVDADEIHALRQLIANALKLPVTILRERNYIEVMAI